MIQVLPSDFSNDDIYTAMEHLVDAVSDCKPKLDFINNDFKAVQKVLKEMTIFDAYMLVDIDYAAFFSWNNDDKCLEIAYDGMARPILEASLEIRIKAHKDLIRLINRIADGAKEIGSK